MSQEASGSPKLSYASGANAAFIDSLYEQYRKDPASVDLTWQRFFEGFEFGLKGDSGAAAAPGAAAGGDPDTAKVEAFINAYRRLGHLSAHLNPLAPSGVISPDMTPEAHGLKGVDMQRKFMPANLPKASLSFPEIHNLLLKTYCGKIGADYRDMNDIEMITWLQEQMESCYNKPEFPAELKKRIHTKLSQAEGFEQFLGRRYIGAKRFSVEGCDALIPMLDVIMDDASREGVEEMCIGMAHRGRLNVLANFMGKPYELILKEFEGSEFNPYDIDGDVKYHMGFASEVGTHSGNRMRLYLSPNPSHLEVVSPVVEGFVRARQRLLNDSERRKVLPILMHGDASFMGQGIVAETFNLCNLDSYRTGGTIHIVINNQIGFTTDPGDSRSTDYSSDIAKMVRAPVLHVNADDPEAVAWCARLATAFRQKFGRDIIIDLVGYRRHGHNEGDEPAFTQPLMYKQIAAHPTVFKQYSDKLVAEGVLSENDVKAVADTFKDAMQVAYEAVHGKKSLNLPAPVVPASLQRCMTYKKASREDVALSVKTGVSAKTLKDVVTKLTTVPDGFTLNPKLVRLLETRRKMVDDGGSVDWGLGELLALGTLAMEGHHIRLTGQDAKRGTFTSRHAVFFDFETNKQYESLNHLAKDQGQVHVINSPLSEMGCLGFEFGYSVADPEAFVAWEAQFGDFANGAQIVIDQFLSASEAKWKQTSGLVMLLPHGHEGQGPEHSSARPERFLQLCGNLNLQVAICTTPAQHFHVLRRQLHREFRKPLVLMTPKSLLREPLCTSAVAEFEKGYFHEILDDESIKKKSSVKKVIFCSGKIYYDLYKARAADEKFKSVPVIRLEQLYPFPYQKMTELLETYPNLEEIIWTQEEPQNMGGWNFVRGRLLEVLKTTQKLSYSGRKNSGTPAEGTSKAHEAEQNRILQDALSRAQGGVGSMAKASK
jgi:2-oxoglutarate dehydrogenase E1 component